MANESPIWNESFEAINTITQYYIVAAATSAEHSVKLATSATGDRLIGVLQNDPSTATGYGLAAEVGLVGITKMVAGGAIGIADRVTCTTAGTGLAATANLQNIIGWAKTASTASGQVISVVLQPLSILSTGA
jgi:hypothetical protein